MGNKMQFLLDYYQYINNIDNLNNSDDLDIYNKSLKQTKNNYIVLAEGLITTHPVNKSVNIIKKRFPNLIIEIEEDEEIYIEGDFGELSNYIPLFNNLGYFISTYTIDGQNWIKKFDEDTKPSALYLEAKYDIRIDIENIPNKLYHTSPPKFKNKILKNGLVLKSSNKISTHPDRIYLTDSLSTAEAFGINLRKEDSGHFKDGFVIYLIDTESIRNLYSDVNLRNSGYYTTDNINKKYINIILEKEY